MKKSFVYVLVMIFFIGFNISVFAAQEKITVFTDGISWNFGYNNPYFLGKKTSSGTAVYCSEFYKEIPNKCKKDNKWNEDSYYAAGIAKIINDSNLSYGKKEILINYFLEQEGFTYSCPNNNVCKYVNYYGTRGKGGYSYIYISGNLKSEMQQKYEAIKNDLNSVNTNSASASLYDLYKVNGLQYDSETNSYNGVLKVYNMGEYSKNDYTVTFSYNGKKYNNCKVTSLKNHWDYTTAGNQRDDLNITCQFDSNNSSKEININVTSQKIYSSNRYDCGQNYQKVFIGTTNKRTVSTKVMVKPAEIKVCEKEDPACKCINDFKTNNAANDPYKRIYLYRFGQGYEEKYTNLLNFEIKDAETACSVATCNTYSNTGCLEGSSDLNDEFNENNLSCYDELINVENYAVGFCSTNFRITSPHLTTFNNGLYAIAGGILFKTSDPLAATGMLNKKCYAYKTYGNSNKLKNGDKLSTLSNYANNNTVYNNQNKYDDYIGDVSLIYNEKNQLVTSIPTSFDFKVTEYDLYYLLEAESIMNYNFNHIYYSLLTGEVTSQKSDKNIDSMEYGIVSSFSDVTDEGSLLFSYKYSPSGNKKNTKNYQAVCNYVTTSGNLIPPSGNLNIEFRTIDTNNPFPSKDAGKNVLARTVGSNWCYSNEEGIVETCSGLAEENGVVASVMSRNNSYNKTKEVPKYTIILTPELITKIRSDNSVKKYDDINLTCEDNVCISDYLTKLRNDGVLTITNSVKRND